jgi:hypothetical protein
MKFRLNTSATGGKVFRRHCIAPDCSRRPWGRTVEALDQIMKDWLNTPRGWVCPEHARLVLAVMEWHKIHYI